MVVRHRKLDADSERVLQIMEVLKEPVTCRELTEMTGFYAAPSLRRLHEWGLIVKVDRRGFNGCYRYMVSSTHEPKGKGY